MTRITHYAPGWNMTSASTYHSQEEQPTKIAVSIVSPEDSSYQSQSLQGSSNIATPYVNSMSNHVIYNQCDLGFGRSRRRWSSLPQRCPYSMRFLANIVIPLVNANQTTLSFPRVLADDMSTYARGPATVMQTIRSFLFTHKFLTVMGAVVRTPNTWAFARSSPARKQLSKL